MGQAHEDRDKRYTAAVMAGVFYCLIGLVGAIVGGLFAAFPKELIIALAGLALMGTIGNGPPPPPGMRATVKPRSSPSRHRVWPVRSLASAVHSGVWWQACWRWWCCGGGKTRFPPPRGEG